MKRRLFFPVLLNLTVVVAVFLFFLFLDINFLTAVPAPRHPEDPPVLKVPAAETAPDQNYRFDRITHFDWSPAHYTDANLPNDMTNDTVLRIGGRDVRGAFYSAQKAYYRFEIVRFTLRDVKPSSQLKVRVTRDGVMVPAYSGPAEIGFHAGAVRGESVASWFGGWKVVPGSYLAVLMDGTNAVARAPFEIITRKPVTFRKTLSFLTLEWNQQIMKRIISDPSGQKVPFPEGLEKWMDFGEVDGFLTLSGQTTGWGNLTPAKPWEYYPLKNLDTLGTAVHARNQLVGAYIMCFYTPAKGWQKGGYTQARGAINTAEGMKITGSSFISFKDPKRFRDIVDLARYFDSRPSVDFIGFDFIRFGENVGYENAAEFVRDMNVDVPEGWASFSEDDRIRWLGRRLRSSRSVNERWKVWVAHKTADFIYRVRREAGLKKPVWVFTLGWDHGTEHGQDPYFFQDAGVFADFVMIYEASPAMFREMKKSWTAYLKDEVLNYIPGNQIDAVLMKSLTGNNPVEEYLERLNTAADYADYRARGVFIHDISRAFWGRRGGYDYSQWLPAGFAGVSYARWRNGEIPFRLLVTNKRASYRSTDEARVQVLVDLEGSSKAPGGRPELAVENLRDGTVRKFDISGGTNIIFTVKMDPRKGAVQFLALKGKCEGYPAYFMVNYIQLVSPVAKSAKEATAVNE